MVTSKLEVLVDFGQIPDKKCVNNTINTLKQQEGVKEVKFENGALLVETTLPSIHILDVVTKTSGKRAVLQGFGDSLSAVAMVSNQSCCKSKVLGVVRFQESSEGAIVVEGAIDGLKSGLHGLQVRECGDLSQGCKSLGDIFNPSSQEGSAKTKGKHAGDLGCVEADDSGRATFRIVDNVLKVSDIIGRSVAITDSCTETKEQGQGDCAKSSSTNDIGTAVACGIIARSSGVFQNAKRICQCDGVLVWDERDKPLAGQGRRSDKPCCGREKEVHG